MIVLRDIPLIDITKSETGCCTLIDPSDWDRQVFEFDNKLFAKVRTRSLLHIPLNMDAVMRSTQAKIDKAGAAAPRWIILSREVSPWHADHYFAVTKAVPGLEMTSLSGTFMTKVFEGPFRDAPDWHRQLIEYAESEGKTPLRAYFFYTTCPSCAKHYGKNYVVGFAQVA